MTAAHSDQATTFDGNFTEKTLRIAIFMLCGYAHAVDLSLVQEILPTPEEIFPVIEAPDFVDGVINLRNKTVPVVNLKKRLNLEGRNSHGADATILILRYRRQLVGLRVDAVVELLSISGEQVEPPTELVAGSRLRFVDGLIHTKSRFLLLLNLDTVLSPDNGQNLTVTIKEAHPAVENTPLAVKTIKIIAFELNDELYGVDVNNVVEIIKPLPIMPLPNVPEFILGLINIRGEILAVIDLSVLFHLDRHGVDDHTRIIVMQDNFRKAGVMVDRVHELKRLRADAFQPPPEDAFKIDRTFCQKVTTLDHRLLTVLEMENILKNTARG